VTTINYLFEKLLTYIFLFGNYVVMYVSVFTLLYHYWSYDHENSFFTQTAKLELETKWMI